MGNYKIAIPSYQRSQLIKDRTLSYLAKCGADMSEVYVFTSNVEESIAYEHSLQGVGCNIVCPTKPILNVTEKFNFLHTYFKEGTNVFVMEDDIKTLVRLGKSGCKPVAQENLAFVDKGFEYCMKAGTKLFGIIPHNNAFYMKFDVSTNLKLIVAHAYGFISDHSKDLLVTQIGKSDYERSILYYLKFGSIIRFNNIGVTTSSYTTEGGMDHNGRDIHEKESCDYLVRRYPHFIKHNEKKKSMYSELSFIRVKQNKPYWDAVQEQRDLELGYGVHTS